MFYNYFTPNTFLSVLITCSASRYDPDVAAYAVRTGAVRPAILCPQQNGRIVLS